MTAFYFDKIENLLDTKTDEIVGILSEKQTELLTKPNKMILEITNRSV